MGLKRESQSFATEGEPNGRTNRGQRGQNKWGNQWLLAKENQMEEPIVTGEGEPNVETNCCWRGGAGGDGITN